MIEDCIVLAGPDLQPCACERFAWEDGCIAEMRLGPEWVGAPGERRVILPGLVNGHTHIGDCAEPDATTSMTLEEGFFRPAGYKYRMLGGLHPAKHLRAIERHLRYMAAGGTVAHLDFREQGPRGAMLLRRAAAATGVQSVILSQFDRSPLGQDALEADASDLPAEAKNELAELLALADGFSESTMNDLTRPAWAHIREATRVAGKLRAIHCLENAGYRELSLRRTGRGDLVRALDEYDADLIVHMTAASDAEIDLLAASGKPCAINPRANASLGLPLPPVWKLLRAGVPLLLGTDNVLLNPPDLWAEMDFCWKVARSQSGDSRLPHPREVLRMVTVHAAPFVPGGQPLGLVEGGAATFVVVDFGAPHLRDSRHLLASLVSRVGRSEVVYVTREGRVLHER